MRFVAIDEYFGDVSLCYSEIGVDAGGNPGTGADARLGICFEGVSLCSSEIGMCSAMFGAYISEIGGWFMDFYARILEIGMYAVRSSYRYA